MSVFELFKQHFIEGGPFIMFLQYIMWILVIVNAIKFFRNYFSKNKNTKKLNKFNSNIIFLGVFGLLLSIFFQHAGFYGALSAIEQTQDISPRIILGGLRVSFIAPLYSYFLFLVSGLTWFVFRNLIKDI
ncbi:MAG: hypothetical protein C0597_10095 [Marinilabiliales bacterium]|nr:MAG: hypothetical protein C0597_10095 [Marinilabiliales bacterium]